MSELDKDRDKDLALHLVPVSRETAGRLDTLVDLLRRWQTIKNLVGPGTLDSIWTRHVADSAQLFPLAPEARRWVDIGSGAGFPGLVLAILGVDQPGFRIDLVESNARKCAFLREVVRMLGLPASIHNGRIEDVLPSLNMDKVDVLTARALAPLPQLLHLGQNLLTTGTVGIFPKGQDLEQELTQASKYWTIETTMVASKTDPKARILIVKRAEPRVVS